MKVTTMRGGFKKEEITFKLLQDSIKSGNPEAYFDNLIDVAAEINRTIVSQGKRTFWEGVRERLF